jgi:hypothetical protein
MIALQVGRATVHASIPSAFMLLAMELRSESKTVVTVL